MLKLKSLLIIQAILDQVGLLLNLMLKSLLIFQVVGLLLNQIFNLTLKNLLINRLKFFDRLTIILTIFSLLGISLVTIVSEEYQVAEAMEYQVVEVLGEDQMEVLGGNQLLDREVFQQALLHRVKIQNLCHPLIMV